MASERAKREAWMAEQTRAIKESTVRGLEPEIQASRGGGWGNVRQPAIKQVQLGVVGKAGWSQGLSSLANSLLAFRAAANTILFPTPPVFSAWVRPTKPS